MFFYLCIFVLLALFSFLTDQIVSRAKKSIMNKKGVQYIGQLDSKKNVAEQTSFFNQQFNLLQQKISNTRFAIFFQRFTRQYLLPEDFTLTHVLAITIGIIFIAWNVAGFLKKSPVFFIFSGFLLEFFIGFFFLSRRRLVDQLDKVFPQILSSLSRVYAIHPDLKAALNFSQQILHDNISQKFLKEANTMIAVGVSPAEALEILAEKWKYQPLFQLRASIQLHQKSGGNIAELFSHMASAHRRQQQSKAAINSALFQNKISALVISFLVPAVFLISFSFSSRYRTVLFTEPTAKSLIVFAGVWWLVGVGIMWKTLKIRL